MWRPEKPRSDDQVMVAAAMLDIGEYQLFAHAYEHWHGYKASDPELEQAFQAYMFLGRVPHWVRDYCRQVLDEAARNDLDPISFGVLPRLNRRVKLGLLLLLVVNAVFWGLVLLAEFGSSRTIDTPGSNNSSSTGLPWMESSGEGNERESRPGR